MRLSRWPKACSRTNGRKRATRRSAPSATRSRLGKCREKFFDHVVVAAEHRDRQIAKARVLGEHRQQRLDDARTETVADDHAVDVAGVERARRALDAERADEADTLADGDRKLRIGAAAAGDQHGRFLERIGVRQLRHALAARGQRLHAAQAPCRAARGCATRRSSRRTIRAGGTLAEIASASGIGAAPSSRVRAMTGVNAPLPASSRSSSARAIFIGALAIAAGLGQHHRFRLDRSHARRPHRPNSFR